MSSSLFPPNPKNKTTVEIRPGVLFQYDAAANAWVKITTNGLAIPLASHIQDGAMTAADLKKLNRLVMPPPMSSIIGTDCVNPFQMGVIGLFSGDKFVGVNGSVDVRNVDDRGKTISETMPFQIHRHTYGFDFTIDLPNLVDELKIRKQFNMTGKKGAQGADGKKGESGPSRILTGSAGAAGPSGSAPPCDILVEPDNLPVVPKDGSVKAIVAARVVADGDGQYKLVLDRQAIGVAGTPAEQLNILDATSPWMLAVSGNQIDGDVVGGNPALCSEFASTSAQSVYYLDVEPLIAVIQQQFLSKVEVVRAGYESVVSYWIQTMSDLFDEQKSALCCSLEHCMSVTKNADLRHRIDLLAATAAGSANIFLHNKESDEASIMSSTRLLKEVGGADTCRGGAPFPQFPNVKGNGQGGFGPDKKPTTITTTPVDVIRSLGVEKQSVDTTDRAIITIDPLLHLSASTGVQVPLQAGNYSVVITKAEAVVDGKYKADARIMYFDGGTRRVVKFLDKGEFVSSADAKSAYEGLGVSFTHDGGMITVWLPNFNPKRATGSIELVLQPTEPISLSKLIASNAPDKEEAVVEVVKTKRQKPRPKEPVPVSAIELVHETPSIECRMSTQHLAWYERGWLSGNCCGVVINMMGQDYIVVKRSIGIDQGCGGGETESEPCIAEMPSHPAFAWPTLDGKNFVPLPDMEYVTFSLNEKLNDIATAKIANNEIVSRGGQQPGTRNLSFHLATILFPVQLL